MDDTLPTVHNPTPPLYTPSIDDPYGRGPISSSSSTFNFKSMLQSGDFIVFKNNHIAQVFILKNNYVIIVSLEDWMPINNSTINQFLNPNNERFIFKIYKPLSNRHFSISRFQKESTNINNNYKLIYENKLQGQLT